MPAGELVQHVRPTFIEPADVHELTAEALGGRDPAKARALYATSDISGEDVPLASQLEDLALPDFRGRSSTVRIFRLGGRTPGRLVACKCVHLDEQPRPHSVLRELELLARASHDNVVKVLYAEEEEVDWASTAVSLWLEACTTDLDRYLQALVHKLPAELRAVVAPDVRTQDLEADTSGCLTLSQYCATADQILRQLFHGLAYLHDDAGVAHRDVKPSNIALQLPHSPTDPPVVKLIDFGVAFDLRDGEEQPPYGADPVPHGRCCVTAVATGSYRAPELLFSPKNGYDGRKLDVWGAACSVAKFYTGWYEVGPPQVKAEDLDEVEDWNRDPIFLDELDSREVRCKDLFHVDGPGEIPLAASIFQLKGLPSEVSEWPEAAEFSPPLDLMPFRRNPPGEILDRLPLARACGTASPELAALSRAHVELIHQCTALSAGRRPFAAQIVSSLQHASR